jgi:hypothetical protein
MCPYKEKLKQIAALGLEIFLEIFTPLEILLVLISVRG